jgi:hypothetical protein
VKQNREAPIAPKVVNEFRHVAIFLFRVPYSSVPTCETKTTNGTRFWTDVVRVGDRILERPADKHQPHFLGAVALHESVSLSAFTSRKIQRDLVWGNIYGNKVQIPQRCWSNEAVDG